MESPKLLFDMWGAIEFKTGQTEMFLKFLAQIALFAIFARTVFWKKCFFLRILHWDG